MATPVDEDREKTLTTRHSIARPHAVDSSLFGYPRPFRSPIRPALASSDRLLDVHAFEFTE